MSYSHFNTAQVTLFFFGFDAGVALCVEGKRLKWIAVQNKLINKCVLVFLQLLQRGRGGGEFQQGEPAAFFQL